MTTTIASPGGPEGPPLRASSGAEGPRPLTRKGGSWLLDDTSPSDVFTPEKLTDEHRLMAKTTAEFIASEVVPSLDRLEAKDWQLARSLIRRSGELGLLAIAVPEEYGGLDLDKASSLAVVERIGPSASFCTTFGGQANLCILPARPLRDAGAEVSIPAEARRR